MRTVLASIVCAIALGFCGCGDAKTPVVKGGNDSAPPPEDSGADKGAPPPKARLPVAPKD